MWMGLRASHPPISPCFPSYLRGAAHLALAQDQWPTASWPAGAHKNIGQGTEILASQALSGGEPDRLRPLQTCPTFGNRLLARTSVATAKPQTGRVVSALSNW